MNYITWLFAGAALGWLVTMVIRPRRSILLMNIVVGMVGGFLAGFLLPPIFKISRVDPGSLSLPVLMVSMGAAVILLAVVNFFRREKDVNDEVIGRNWVLVRNKLNARWNKLTKNDIDQINGNYIRFISTLQARYGYAEDEAEDQIQRYLTAVLRYSRTSSP